MKFHKAWPLRWLLCSVLLLPARGCTLATDLLNPDLVSALGYPAGSLQTGSGTVIIAFENQTAYPAVFLAFEMSSMLVGESALPEQDAAIREALERAPDIERVIHLKTLHVGPDELLVAAKIAIRGEDDATTIARGIDRAEACVREAVPTARFIYLEPDLDRYAAGPSE